MIAQTQKMTPLAAAERELAAADAEVAKIEREIQPTEEKFGALQEQLDNATQTRGTGSPDARKATTGLAGLSKEVAAGRRRLEIAQRRRGVVAERVESERRAIADLKQRIAAQQQREARQVAAIDDTERQLREKRIALDVERKELRRLRDELAGLIGEDDDAHTGEP